MARVAGGRGEVCGRMCSPQTSPAPLGTHICTPVPWLLARMWESRLLPLSLGGCWCGGRHFTLEPLLPCLGLHSQVLGLVHLDERGSIDRPGSGPKCRVTPNLITDIIPKRKPGPDSLMVTFEVFLRTVVTSGSILGEWHVAAWVQVFFHLALFPMLGEGCLLEESYKKLH